MIPNVAVINSLPPSCFHHRLTAIGGSTGFVDYRRFIDTPVVLCKCAEEASHNLSDRKSHLRN